MEGNTIIKKDSIKQNTYLIKVSFIHHSMFASCTDKEDIPDIKADHHNHHNHLTTFLPITGVRMV